MKFFAVIFLCVVFDVNAQMIRISGHDFGVVFDDATLSATNKAIIAKDIVCLLSPSTNSAVYAPYSTPTQEGLVGEFQRLHGPGYYPKTEMPQQVKRNATNGLDIVVSKALSDEYLSAIAFMQNHQTAWARADSFAVLIITNSFTNIPPVTLSSMLLSKSNAPGTFSSYELAEFAQDHSGIAFYMPSLLSYHLENEGPGGGSYLWGTLPNSMVMSTGIPMIYYQNQWRISWWLMEPGDQTW